MINLDNLKYLAISSITLEKELNKLYEDTMSIILKTLLDDMNEITVWMISPEGYITYSEGGLVRLGLNPKDYIGMNIYTYLKETSEASQYKKDKSFYDKAFEGESVSWQKKVNDENLKINLMPYELEKKKYIVGIGRIINQK
jgi:hypothetical protein